MAVSLTDTSSKGYHFNCPPLPVRRSLTRSLHWRAVNVSTRGSVRQSLRNRFRWWAEPLSRRKRGWRPHRAPISVRGGGCWPFSEAFEAYFSFFGGFFGGCFLTIYGKIDFFAFFGGFLKSNFEIIYIYIIYFDSKFDSNHDLSRLVLICLHER